MKKIMTLGVILMASASLAACNRAAAPVANNTAAPKATNTVAPAPAPSNAAAPAGNSAAPAAAGDATNQNFTLNNRSTDTITHVYVSPVSSDNWGPDVLGTQVLPAGGNAEITFPRSATECNWDIRVTVNGQNSELRNINLCETTDVDYGQ